MDLGLGRAEASGPERAVGFLAPLSSRTSILPFCKHPCSDLRLAFVPVFLCLASITGRLWAGVCLSSSQAHFVLLCLPLVHLLFLLLGPLSLPRAPLFLSLYINIYIYTLSASGFLCLFIYPSLSHSCSFSPFLSLRPLLCQTRFSLSHCGLSWSLHLSLCFSLSLAWPLSS